MVNPVIEQKPQESSVANDKNVSVTQMIERGLRKRIPMSAAVRRMEVPAVDGYYLYWFKETNVEKALEAGYEFVNRQEVKLVETGLANDRSVPGNTDLGTRVSMIGDSVTENGPQRAYLMKLRQEWRNEDKAALDAKNAAILGAIFKGESIFAPEGTTRELGNTEYVKRALFNRPTRKAKIGT